MEPISQLLALSEAYRSHREISESRVSTILFQDGKRLKAVRNGSDMSSRLVSKGLRWFADNWPADANWPTDIPRPVSTEAA